MSRCKNTIETIQLRACESSSATIEKGFKLQVPSRDEGETIDCGYRILTFAVMAAFAFLLRPATIFEIEADSLF